MSLQNHLVTVLIITFNRANDLQITLSKLKQQDYKNLEIIVVDNASNDKTISMISKHFPQINLIKSKKNIGIAAFNLGLQQAKGEFILLLDDDSYPLSGTILNGIKILSNDDDIALVAFNIYNKKFKFYETEHLPDSYPIIFLGGGVLIRKSIINKIGFYDDLYFIYHNEIDLSIRLANEGYKMVYLKGSMIIHEHSDMARKEKHKVAHKYKSKFYHNFVGRGIFLLKFFSLKYIFMGGGRLLVNKLIIAVFYGYILTYFKSLLRLIILFPRIIRKRKKVKPEIQRLYNYGKLNFIDRTFFPNYRNNTNIKPKYKSNDY